MIFPWYKTVHLCIFPWYSHGGVLKWRYPKFSSILIDFSMTWTIQLASQGYLCRKLDQSPGTETYVVSACFTIPYLTTHGNNKQQQSNTPFLWPSHVGFYVLYMDQMGMVYGRYNYSSWVYKPCSCLKPWLSRFFSGHCRQVYVNIWDQPST